MPRTARFGSPAHVDAPPPAAPTFTRFSAILMTSLSAPRLVADADIPAPQTFTMRYIAIHAAL